MSEKHRLVDIILPTYNSQNSIIKTVNSIINQSYKNWRLIIIDDASEDKTLEILNTFYLSFIKKKKIHIIKNLKNNGQSYCRNIGIRFSKSKFIAFIDSDDLWSKKKLEYQIKFMTENNYVFTYTDYIVSKKNKKYNVLAPLNFNLFKFVKNTSIATSTMIVCRNVITNFFPEKIKLCEDYLFKCKLLKKYDAYKCPGTLAKYIVRRGSLQSSRIKVVLAVWHINEKYNNMKFFENLFSVISISVNSILKYGFR